LLEQMHKALLSIKHEVCVLYEDMTLGFKHLLLPLMSMPFMKAGIGGEPFTTTIDFEGDSLEAITCCCSGMSWDCCYGDSGLGLGTRTVLLRGT